MLAGLCASTSSGFNNIDPMEGTESLRLALLVLRSYLLQQHRPDGGY